MTPSSPILFRPAAPARPGVTRFGLVSAYLVRTLADGDRVGSLEVVDDPGAAMAAAVDRGGA